MCYNLNLSNIQFSPKNRKAWNTNINPKSKLSKISYKTRIYSLIIEIYYFLCIFCL